MPFYKTKVIFVIVILNFNNFSFVKTFFLVRLLEPLPFELDLSCYLWTGYCAWLTASVLIFDRFIRIYKDHC